MDTETGTPTTEETMETTLAIIGTTLIASPLALGIGYLLLTLAVR